MLNRFSFVFAAAMLAGSAHAQSCVPSTTGVDLQARINATPANGTLYLCPRAQISAVGQIMLKPYLKLETLGRPVSDSDKAKITLASTTTFPVSIPIGQSFIAANGMSGVELRNIVIDGGRTSVSMFQHKIQEAPGVSPDHWRATLAMGGTNSLLDRVTIVNAMGGAAIDAASDPYCSGFKMTNSSVLSAGFYQTAPNSQGQRISQWADGLNLRCSNAFIANNQFRDVTDGSISLYGGTNTVIQSNWIAASGRSGVSAFVAAAAMDGTFSGSSFSYNLIETTPNQHFDIAISLGSMAWCGDSTVTPATKDCQMVSGMTANNNQGAGTFGYGLLVAGMKNATMLNNNLTMTRWINPDWVIGSAANYWWCQKNAANQPDSPNYYVVLDSNATPNLQPGYVTRNKVDRCSNVPIAY